MITAAAMPKTDMTSISFITPYMPIICGIADYTGFIARDSAAGTWDVISFDLANYGAALSNWQAGPGDHVRYCIPSRRDCSASSVLEALNPDEDRVLWFQHEFGIWSNSERFVSMLRDLNYPRVVTLHTLHYQSDETVYGLRRQEYSFLRRLLPHTDAITVFSNGVFRAVTEAFAEYADKVHLLRHGSHLYPAVSALSRVEAREMLHEYLVGQSDLDRASKDRLNRERLLLDHNTAIIGGTGFITASKGTQVLYYARDVIQDMLPGRRIAALYVGHLRETDSVTDRAFAAGLRAKFNNEGQFFLETYLPREMLAVLLRALDVYFYWPSDCTQSGIVAHALGAGATIACRDLEGVGETVRQAGGLVEEELGRLLTRLSELIISPRLQSQASENAVKYAQTFSWRNQALRHFDLAEQLSSSRAQSIRATSPDFADSSARGADLPGITVPFSLPSPAALVLQ